MRRKEVVVGDDKRSDEPRGAVIGFKAAAWADMELEGSVETFDELFKRLGWSDSWSRFCRPMTA